MRRKAFIGALFLLVILAALYLLFLRYEQIEESKHITLFGNVDVRQVDIAFRVQGRVQEINFEEGDLVTPNSLVGKLDKQPYEDQVSEAAARIQSVKATLDNAEQILKRRQELITDGSVSEEDLQNAFANVEVTTANLKEAESALAVAKANLSFTEAYAPTEGTVLTRVREPGSIVNPGDPICTISITSPVWIRAFIAEPQLGLVYPGMQAEVFTDTKAGVPYSGRVGFISPVAEFTPKTVETTQLRTDLVYRLRIYVDNPDKGLRQGMPVTVQLPLRKEQQ